MAASGPTLTVAQTCAWSDLRRRWRSWIVLGLLAGLTVGLACAGFAGARRTSGVVSNYAIASDAPDAAILANDPDYDEDVRAAVAQLPEVERTAPFMVPFLMEVTSPAGMDIPLLPLDADRPLGWDPIVEGRLPDPARPDEIVINEALRDQFDLAIGDTVTVEQPAVDIHDDELPFPVPDGAAEALTATLRVVGISNAVSDEPDWVPSAAFYDRFRTQLAGPINEMVHLHDGADDLPAFRDGVEAIMGHPVNIENVEDLFGIRSMRKISDVERGALVLFAVAVLVGGIVLVGQALVRAVRAGAADLMTWRALGVDNRTAITAVTAPAIGVAAVGALTVIGVAIALSPRFPVAFSRRIELDIGLHADWLVVGAGVALLVIAVLGAAWTTALLTVRRGDRSVRRPSAVVQWASTLSSAPPVIVGTRLAVEPGRGHRAVPVRSAFVGAIVGVLGVVGCLTVGRGLRSTVDDPARAGVTWDVAAGIDGLPPPDLLDAITNEGDVTDAVSAVWARAVEINGRSVPTFGTSRLKGDIDFVVLEGRPPVAADDVAMAPVTMDELGLHIGDEILVGPGSTVPATVVGRVLLPATSHTEYDQSAWMTSAGLQRALPPGLGGGSDFGESYVLMRWKEGIAATEQHDRLTALGVEYVERPRLPAAVEGLSNVLAVPVVLAVFFALIAVATVAHALVTTVGRRRHDLAVLRSIGLTRRDSRLAIMWQASLLAVVGLVVGVPLGIAVGRFVWRQIADRFPVVYAPPLALLAVVLVIPLALMIANLLAAGPARAATRIHPAIVLRSE